MKKPTAVGSQGGKDKETVRQSDAVEILFDVLIKPSENRDFEEYEFLTEGDDDDCVSIVSSCMGSRSSRRRPLGEAIDGNGPAVEEEQDWEQLNEKDREETIANLLKNLGNVKKKRMSAFILKYMLGIDGEFAL